LRRLDAAPVPVAFICHPERSVGCAAKPACRKQGSRLEAVRQLEAGLPFGFAALGHKLFYPERRGEGHPVRRPPMKKF